MGKKKKKSKKFKELTPEVLEKVTNALSTATVSLLGFNPNYEYKILPNTKMADLTSVPEDILKLQETAIFIEQETAEDLLKCRKYIYKIEKRVIKEAADNGDYVHTQTLFHLIGKSKYGYIPSTLIITKYDWKNDTFFKSSYATRLKGEKFIVLQRIDTSGQAHINSFLDSDGKLLQSDTVKRYIPAGQAHQHKYSDVVMKYHYNNLMSHNGGNPIQAMFYKKSMKLDASKENAIKTCDELLERNISYLNISCIRECEEDESLGDFYEYCQETEEKTLNILKNTDSTIKPHFTRLPFYKIKENIDYIRDKGKPKEQVEAVKPAKNEVKSEKSIKDKQHIKHFDYGEDYNENKSLQKRKGKTKGKEYEKNIKHNHDRQQNL